MNVARLARQWVSRLLPGAGVLGYHRVAHAERDPFRLCVSPEHFSEHLEVLSRRHRPLSMDALMRQLADGGPDKGTVAVTLDDGYVDNLSAAKPALERWAVPATIHVVTDDLGGRFWWDDLADLVPDDRNLCRLHSRLVRLPQRQRAAAIEAIRAGRERGLGNRNVRAMTAEELHALGAGGLIALGAHSLTHQMLTTLDVEGQRAQIAGSRAQLEEIAGRTVEAFAYPHGAATTTIRAITKAAGFRWACGAHGGVVRGGADAFYVPRLWPPDVDGDRFERWLAQWMPSVRRATA